MRLGGLRDPRSWGRLVDQWIAVDDGDSSISVREDSGGKHPGHTGSDDDSVVREAPVNSVKSRLVCDPLVRV